MLTASSVSAYEVKIAQRLTMVDTTDFETGNGKDLPSDPSAGTTADCSVSLYPETEIGPPTPAEDAAVFSIETSEESQPNFSLSDVEIGKKDQRGRLVVDILWAVREFKIFKTEQGISLHFSDDVTTAAQQRELYLKLGEELSQLNHLIQLLPRLRPRKKFLSRKGTEGPKFVTNLNPVSIFYERELARGIAQALVGDAEMGKATLASLAKRLEKRLRNKGRVRYFSVCLFSALAIVTFASWFLVNSTGIVWSEVAMAAIFGSVGALLSTAVGLRNLSIDADSTLFMNWIYGGQRMLVGVLGAITIYLALQAGVVLELLSGANGSSLVTPLDPHKIAFISILAGFSERLVPNLLERDSANGSQS